MAIAIQGTRLATSKVSKEHRMTLERLCWLIDDGTRWRLFLPAKWRNASALNQDGIMDPNLTLAHVTHNTAVIQLHQSIAFPSTDWRDAHVSLPSEASLNTCISAACEVGSISQRFLEQNSGVTNPQLSFCLFIAGRVLLGTSHYHEAQLTSKMMADVFP